MIRTLFAVCLVASSLSWAQSDDDAPIPYDDDTTEQNEYAPRKAKKKKRADTLREEEEDAKDRDVSLTSVDDPNVGVGFSFLSGVALLEASRNGIDPRYYLGARFTWEFGRLIPDEYLREIFFADVMWLYTWTSDGTDLVRVTDHIHDFTVAPAFALRLGESFMSAYAQVGAGFSYTQSVTTVDATNVSLGGTKFLFQYGIGLRGRPALTVDKTVRLEFRIELTRFIRGYIHDMVIGGSLGLIF